jgi:hypothetical protein
MLSSMPIVANEEAVPVVDETVIDWKKDVFV